jgi:acyl-CoA thioester hydrolase
LKIRVYYEDTDAGGIVYHTNYIKYCERARSEIFFSKDIKPLDGENSGFVVKKLEANFFSFASLGDMVDVVTRVVKRKSASVLLEQTIYMGDNRIFSMVVLLAFVKNGKPKAIPESLKDYFEKDMIYK